MTKLFYFYPRSPCGERLQLASYFCQRLNFYPRSPCGERHFSGSAWVQEFPISIHALLAESDIDERGKFGRNNRFLSTLSLRRATVVDNIVFVPGQFLSTLSLRRATHPKTSSHPHNRISIHALLAESDPAGRFLLLILCQISIHALLAESDGGSGVGSWPRGIFLSTLSLRRATLHCRL